MKNRCVAILCSFVCILIALNIFTVSYPIVYVLPVVLIDAVLGGMCIIALIRVLFFLPKYIDFGNRCVTFRRGLDILKKDSFIERCNRLIRRNRDYDYIMIAIDISKFHLINARYGYDTGDDVMRQLGEHIRSAFGRDAVCGYLLDDCFCVMLRDNNDIMEQCRQLIEMPFYAPGIRRCIADVHVKVGLCMIEAGRGPVSCRTYMDKANLSKYSIKERMDKNIALFDDEMQKQLDKEQYIEQHMKTAVQNHEFEIYYQPKYQTKTNCILGAEALIRWNVKDDMILTPDMFIPLFERNGFVLTLDFYVFNEVMSVLCRRLKAGQPVVPVSMNLSRLHLDTHDFFLQLEVLLEKYDIPRSLIEFEITETALGKNDIDAVLFLTKLKNMGFTVSIDDFGSGYSSLSLLRNIPVDILKIDAAFLEEHTSGNKSSVILKKIVEMAHELSLKTVCEGVETQSQFDFLQSVDCDSVQGFLFSKPMQGSEFYRLLDSSRVSQGVL